MTSSSQRAKLISDKISVEMFKSIFFSNLVQSCQRSRVEEISAFRWHVKLLAVCWNRYQETAETFPRWHFCPKLSDNCWKMPLQPMVGQLRPAKSRSEIVVPPFKPTALVPHEKRASNSKASTTTKRQQHWQQRRKLQQRQWQHQQQKKEDKTNATIRNINKSNK